MILIPEDILEQFLVNKSTSSSSTMSSTSSTTATATDGTSDNSNNIDGDNSNNIDSGTVSSIDGDGDDIRLRLIPNPCGLLNHYDVYNNDWLLVGTGNPIECMRLIERVVWANFIDININDYDDNTTSDIDSNGDSNGVDDNSSSSGSSGDGEIQYIDLSIDGTAFRSSSSSSLLSKLSPSSILHHPPSMQSILTSSSSSSSSLLESESVVESDQSLTIASTNNNININNDLKVDLTQLYEIRCKPGNKMDGPCPVDRIDHPSVQGHHFYAMSVYFYALHCIKYYSPISLLHW